MMRTESSPAPQTPHPHCPSPRAVNTPLRASFPDQARSIAESLPRAPVLQYLAGVSTPTQARQTAAAGAILVGLASLLLILVIFGVTWWQVDYLASAWRPGPPRPILSRYLSTVADLDYWYLDYWYSSSFWLEMVLRAGILVRLLLIAMLLAPGLGLLVLARPIYLGSSPASRLSVALIVPFVLLLLPPTAILPGMGLVRGLGRNPERIQLLWLLVLPLGVLLLLILKDLCAYLLWIGRNAMLDKPPVPFVNPKVRALGK